MGSRRSECSIIVTNMFNFIGSLAEAAVVAVKKLICYINDLTIVDTFLEMTDDEEQKSEARNIKINAVAD